MSDSVYFSHDWQTPIHLKSLKFTMFKGVLSTCAWSQAKAEILKCEKCRSLAYKVTNELNGKIHFCPLSDDEILNCHEEQLKELLS